MITLPLPPLSTNHGYHVAGGRFYKDKRLKDWEEECLGILKPFVKKVQVNYAVSIVFYFGNKRKNDIDGKIKPILDLLQKAGFYPDDSLVTELHVVKEYDTVNPCVKVSCL